MAPMLRVAHLFMKTPAQGALTPVYLAPHPRPRGVSRYFANRKPKTSNKASYDTTAAARLGQADAGLTGTGATA